MKHLFYPLAAASLLILTNCNKSKEDANSSLVGSLSGEYQATGLIAASSPIVMYTGNGQINEPALIDKFLSRRFGAAVSTYFSRTDVPITNGSTRILTLDASDQATEVSTYSNSSTTTKSTVTLHTPHYLVLSGNDSITVVSGNNTLLNPCTAKSETVRTISSPIQICHPLPFSSGYSQSCKYRPLQAIGIRNGQLFIPALSWILKSSIPITPANPANFCIAGASNQRDVFNPASLNQLAISDTLVIQSREISLVKK